MDQRFIDTSGTVAKEADVSEQLVRKYADLKLIDYVMDSRGHRLFRPGTAKQVRQIYVQRMLRGRGTRS